MKVGNSFIAKFAWTAGTFGGSALLRFALNILLSRLLTPDIMGTMVVVNAVRLGIELLTDVGIEQNIVHHGDGAEREFRDTAWTLQVLRGALLSAVFVASAPVFAQIYEIDVRVFLLAACSPIIGALHSTAIFVLVKNLEVRRRNLFELSAEALAFVVSVGLAYWLGSVWAPAFALVAAVAIRTALSYALPDPVQHFRLDRAVARRIVVFGKWIALTSLVMYAASYLDRLYLGTVTPLAYLGIFGIARAISDLPANLARRMSYQILFPAFAASAGDRDELRGQIESTRRIFVVGAVCALCLASACSDLFINAVYDKRYAEAGWMLSILLIGGVFSVLSNLNEALILGAGRPSFASLTNILRLATLAVALPLGFGHAGFAGAVIAIALTEVLQCLYVAGALVRLRTGYWGQDGLALGAGSLVLCATLAVRFLSDNGSPFSTIAWTFR